MIKPEDVITDKAIEIAFDNVNFCKQHTNREIVANSLLKCACGYSTGHTAKCILEELGLVNSKWQLTAIGKEYLWAAHSKGISL